MSQRPSSSSGPSSSSQRRSIPGTPINPAVLKMKTMYNGVHKQLNKQLNYLDADHLSMSALAISDCVKESDQIVKHISEDTYSELSSDCKVSFCMT